MGNSIQREKQIVGVVGLFDDPESLIEATEKVRDSKFKHFDCFTPYPVHGLEHAQGLKRSKVPYVTGFFAFTGTTLAFLLQYYASVTSWPHIIGGKPYNSLPAFVPIIFEGSILLGGIATFLGMLAFNRLPNLKQKAFDPSITDNRFAIVIDNPNLDKDPEDQEEWIEWSAQEAETFLKSLGAKDVRQAREEGWFE